MNQIKKLTEVIRNHAECDLDIGTLRTLKMIDDEADKLNPFEKMWKDFKKHLETVSDAIPESRIKKILDTMNIFEKENT